jgi:hypothetical protein
LFSALQAGVYHAHGVKQPEGVDLEDQPIVRDWAKIYAQNDALW